MRLALFDLDGTITTRDTLADFLLQTFGLLRCAAGLLSVSPFLLLYLLKLIPGGEAKEKVFRYFLSGWGVDDFATAADRYARERMPAILRERAMDRIAWHRSRGDRMVVVSASAEEWVRSWCAREGMETIGTRLETRDGRFTGRILGENCSGPEKARRIREKISLDDYEYIYAYGNSGGDAEMLALAHERYYQWKRMA
ncbi:MAG: HAD-IB family hydrolase [Spirochaetes bacterium]|nr:HAD-IB family hydrolase [Spirochaetota bacterium]